MATVKAIGKVLLSTIGRIVKFSIMLVIAMIVSLLLIANTDGMPEGMGLIITWLMFIIGISSKKSKKRNTEEE